MALSFSLAEARRIAIAAQGLAAARPARVTRQHVRRVIQQLGLIQIDFVNVLVPAHYLVPFSRLGAYDRGQLDHLVYRTEEFTEQWAHEASIVPMEAWPLLRHRMEARGERPYAAHAILRKQPGYRDWVVEQIGERGPLAGAALSGPGGGSGRVAGENGGRDALDGSVNGFRVVLLGCAHEPELLRVGRAQVKSKACAAIGNCQSDRSRAARLGRRDPWKPTGEAFAQLILA